jgi:hypothetical protein
VRKFWNLIFSEEEILLDSQIKEVSKLIYEDFSPTDREEGVE